MSPLKLLSQAEERSVILKYTVTLEKLIKDEKEALVKVFHVTVVG